MEKISQSLAGRVAVFNLLPFSTKELEITEYQLHSPFEYIVKSFYPRIYDEKTPKLYFYDTGLASSLLGIRSAADLENHPMRGPLFENFIVVEFMKQFLHRGQRPNCYYWRDNTGHEIDLLIEHAGQNESCHI